MIKSFLTVTLSNSILLFAQLRIFTGKLFGNTEWGAQNVVVPPLLACACCVGKSPAGAE